MVTVINFVLYGDILAWGREWTPVLSRKKISQW